MRKKKKRFEIVSRTKKNEKRRKWKKWKACDGENKIIRFLEISLTFGNDFS
jgi:hypothetical protein